MANEHERARRLMVLAEASPGAEQAWLRAHMESCAACRQFAENAAGMIEAMRAIPVAAGRSLVATTQSRVRQRALELQRQRERVWLVSVSCVAVTALALLSSVVLWRGFAWLGERAQLAPPVWEVGFLVFCMTPALVVGVLLLARGAHLADHTGSYEG